LGRDQIDSRSDSNRVISPTASAAVRETFAF
jgi:hypothetical protein